MNEERLPLRPFELCLGNFIDSMGKVEIITGIVIEEGNKFRIAHTGWNEGDSLMPSDVLYSAYPIPLTFHWKICFSIENIELPKWVKYVHQAQQYFFIAHRINLSDQIDWDLLPKEIPFY